MVVRGRWLQKVTIPPFPPSTWVALGSLLLAEGVEWGLAEGCWEEQLASPSCAP